MRYLSVCSGIEAATVAWHPLGWQPFAFAEIEKFPSAVLAHHYPHVPNLGDMTKFKDWPDAAIDVLVGGTPCQSFSVAGLRKGLADPRGNLALTYLALVDRYRPEWFIWENVPGVLSTDDGRAFGSILGGMAELGYGWAYRILDAQYVRVDGFGRAVPQRRRRVFVVGNSGSWRRAAAVLFEPESLSGDTAPRRQTGQRVAPTISARTQGGGGLGTDFDCDGGLISSSPVASTLNAHYDGTGRGTPLVPVAYSIMPQNSGKDYKARQVEVAQPVMAGGPVGGNQGGDYICQPVAFAENSRAELRLCGGDGSVSSQLTTGGGKPGQGQPCIAIQERAICENHDAGSPALDVGKSDGMAVAYDLRGREDGSQFEGPHETANIRAASGCSSRSYVAQTWAVRRLTPKECERLQGFPDGYTDVPWRKKNWTPDGPRYKALGNSMAVNAMRWLGRRIEMVTACRMPTHSTADR